MTRWRHFEYCLLCLFVYIHMERPHFQVNSCNAWAAEGQLTKPTTKCNYFLWRFQNEYSFYPGKPWDDSPYGKYSFQAFIRWHSFEINSWSYSFIVLWTKNDKFVAISANDMSFIAKKENRIVTWKSVSLPHVRIQSSGEQKQIKNDFVVLMNLVKLSKLKWRTQAKIKCK